MHCDPKYSGFTKNMFQSEPSYCFPINLTKLKGKRNLINPGSVHNIHNNAKEIEPKWIEGVQFCARKLIESNKSVYCNWLLSHAHPTGFRVGGTFQRILLNNDVLTTPYIQADINPSTFATNLGFIYFPHSKLGLEATLQVAPCNIFSGVFTCNYLGSNNTFSVTLHEPTTNTGRIIVSHLYKINSTFSLGGELMLQWFHGIIGHQTAIAAKYQRNKMALAATCSRHAIDVTYWQKITDNLQLGSSYVANSLKEESVGSFFYQWEYKDVVVRGLIDSKWTVGFTYTKSLKNLSSSFGLSLYWCVLTNKFSCGFKFDLDDALPKHLPV